MAMVWPSLPLDAWRPTKETLHRFTQIIGKIQLALTPVVSHFWNVTLRPTARGLATSALRYDGRTFDLELDFVEHRTVVRTSDGGRDARELRPIAVADYYRELMQMLDGLGIRVHIWDHPVEIMTDTIPFTQDRMHAAYDPEYAARFFQVVSNAAEVLDKFRARFIGTCSGVGFYWGTFDLAVGRYSGKRAPLPPAAGPIEREAYSHEVSEVGFWPGDAKYGQPAFYALHYPEPAGFARAKVRPELAHWQESFHGFVLPYEVCHGPDATAQILEFCQSTYEAGADLAGWNRAELERPLAT